jgi:hypothetical protein
LMLTRQSPRSMIRRLSSMRLAKIASPLAGIRAETGAACSTSALAPILFGFPLYRRCVRVLALDPMRRAPRAIARVLALRHDALQSYLAGMGKDGGAVSLNVLVEVQAGRGLATTEASVALRTSSGSRRRSSPFNSIRFKGIKKHGPVMLVVGSSKAQTSCGAIVSTKTLGSSAISTISSAKSSARNSCASVYSSRNSLWRAIQRENLPSPALGYRTVFGNVTTLCRIAHKYLLKKTDSVSNFPGVVALPRALAGR